MNRTGGKIPRPKPSIPKIPGYIIFPIVGLTGSLVYGYYAFLEEAPFTKRKRIIATSPSFERKMGDDQYKALLKQHRNNILPPDHRASITVKRVGSRLSLAANDFAKRYITDGSNATSPYTYTIVKSDEANAFVLPNNHVFVLTGLFKYVRNEDELAAVLGHEMAHNLARHAGEKLSGGILISIVANVVWLIDPSGFLVSLFLPAATLLSELPHSREAEVEADHIGLRLAAQACYDPNAAKRVFEAMEKGDPSGKGIKEPPEFLSTHPSNNTRITNFNIWMPEARTIFDSDGGYRCRQVREDMELARRRAAEEANRRENNGSVYR